MDWKAILKNLAPTAATLIGGPLAALAVKTIGDAIGVPEATVEKIEKAITSGTLAPEHIIAMRTADDALKVKLAEMGVKLEEVAAADRKDARAMMVATGARTPAVLSWVIVIATLFLEGWVLINGMPKNADPVIAGRILGTLDMAFATVLAYWLGAAYRQITQRASDAAR